MPNRTIEELLKDVRVVLFDFDGTMTDGSVIVDQNGLESVRVSRKDGLGISMLNRAGYEVAVVSKEENPVVVVRCKKLRILCYQGIDDKSEFLMRMFGHRLSQVLFMGDDINDLECIQLAGVGVTVADGHSKCKDAASYITQARGGDHAVREVCDLILNTVQS